MFDAENSSDRARAVFAGLTPTVVAEPQTQGTSLAAKGMMATVPIVLAGALTVTGAIAPVQSASAADRKTSKPKAALGSALRAAAAATVAKTTVTPPATHTVTAGDTVSSIAARYGLATASVLAANGLGWKSLIFPGQVLKLTNAAVAPTPAPAPAPVASSGGRYTIVKGDTISGIAARFGVSTASVLTANGLSASSIIYPGQTIAIPGGTLSSTPVSSVTPAPAPAPAPSNGSTYVIASGDTVSSIAAKFGVSVQAILDANGLQRSSIIYAGRTLTIPGASLAITPVSSVSPIEANDPPSTPVVGPPTGASYVIASGDTVSSIAAKFGVSVQTILDANGLQRTSIIYAGRTLTIPGVAAAPRADGLTPLTNEMRANALIIVQIGRDLGVSDRGIIIALATAMQESSLRNINYGDRDSLGLFQQRPSSGWGTPEQILDAAHAARLFYGGPLNPNKGKTRGLLDIPGWQSMSLTQAAQAVQISAFPNAYAKWEASATAWLAQLS
ncbi:LysM peptidoglycan-binding domain-containing protein [Salinibacterium sp. ZJ77]|uniref:muramidase family protein n=1 Tax=Salinibacterium sp. ZJ77 TaxID=2708337 RepID=UPI001FB9B63E|nr:LysM peptidoglycan-binding domain-containing protein [Salinibacterium sp. ZJ77]